MPLPSFWGLTGNLQCSLACRRTTLISAFPFTWCSPSVHLCIQISLFYKDIGHIGLGPTLLQYGLTLNNYICKDPVTK